jgi:sec-independent protein translocase protein TatA
MLANIFGDWYWIVLAVIVLFGGSQLPKLARNSGEALKEFRKAHTDEPDPSAAVGGPAAAPPALTSTPVPVAPTAEERITLSRAELDALLAAREARAKAEDAKGAGAQA